MKIPVGEYQRFEYLARCLFAVSKDSLKRARSESAKRNRPPKNSAQKTAPFLPGLRRFAMKAMEQHPLQCSFCGKTAQQVQFLVAGGGNPPSVYICGECVDLSVSIIEKTKASGNAPSAP
jgi:hypothetical protein